jgi:hypothetical protein
MGIKLDPKCFKDLPMALTNEGHLVPCCYCDDHTNMNDLEFKELLRVSKLNDHNSIDEIVNSPEWKRFEERLRNHQGPPVCIQTCRVRENDNDIIRKDTHFDPNSKKIIKVRNI